MGSGAELLIRSWGDEVWTENRYAVGKGRQSP